MIDTAIYTVLSGDSGVSNLVGTRIYPLYAPQEPTLPYLVFRRVSIVNRDLTQSGVSGLARSRFQIDSYADDPLEAKQLAAAVRSALHGYSGTVGSEEILKSESVNEIDGFDLDLGAVVSLDFIISYTET